MVTRFKVEKGEEASKVLFHQLPPIVLCQKRCSDWFIAFKVTFRLRHQISKLRDEGDS